MSHVTSFILVTSLRDGASGDNEERPNADEFNRYLEENHRCRLGYASDVHDGTKIMGCDVFTGAVNYADVPSIKAKFRSIKWDYPYSAQLMIKDQDDNAFTVFCAADTEQKESGDEASS